MSKVFPTAMIVLSIFSALVYMGEGDWRQTIYWLSAATLTTVVTF